MIKNYLATLLCLTITTAASFAQFVILPDGGVNQKSMAGQRIGITDVTIHWNAPGVKGREGKIWGTDIAHFGFKNLGFGTAKASPWRAGANENTTIAFSTDVMVEGKTLKAGKYGFFIAVYPDSCVLIFSSNADAWGAFFYKPEQDQLRVTVRQQKDLPRMREWLTYTFAEPTANTAVIALEWEHWRIPFKVEVDLKKTVVASIQGQMSGAMGFDPPSLQTAAQWCLSNDVNLEEALVWANTACDPNLGNIQTFTALSIKAGLEEKLGLKDLAAQTRELAMNKATVIELHVYGKQLLSEKKPKDALAIFEKNHQINGDKWPVHVGLMRGYSANGDLKKALEHAKIALTQAPDDLNQRNLEKMVKTLSEGKALGQ